ncbi:MAG: SRPBCC domain-containing protein [Bacteroidota bacterium]|nr:SRPBCC domain-containing protein [Bacteroidota bacterium]
MKTYSISMSAFFDATPEQVFRALTDSKQIEVWSGQSGKVELKKNGKVKMFNEWAKGSVLKFSDGKTLEYTWHTADWDDHIEASVVKFSFSSTAKGAKVSLRHVHLPSAKEAQSHKEGWKEFVFDPLKEFFRK